MKTTIYKEDAIQALNDTTEIKGYAYTRMHEALEALPEADAMPEYIEDDKIVHHYLNGMVAMNERAYQNLRRVSKEPSQGRWRLVRTIKEDGCVKHLLECSACSGITVIKAHTTIPRYCEYCRAYMLNSRP